MKSTILIYLVASFCHIHGQQYRLVPTCSNEPLDPNNPVALKGDKGDNGIPGKAGPPGFGVKGVKGEIGNCTRFSRDLNARLDSKYSDHNKCVALCLVSRLLKLVL